MNEPLRAALEYRDNLVNIRDKTLHTHNILFEEKGNMPEFCIIGIGQKAYTKERKVFC